MGTPKQVLASPCDSTSHKATAQHHKAQSKFGGPGSEATSCKQLPGQHLQILSLGFLPLTAYENHGYPENFRKGGRHLSPLGEEFLHQISTNGISMSKIRDDQPLTALSLCFIPSHLQMTSQTVFRCLI